MKLTEWVYNRLPIYTRNDVDSGYVNGFIAGAKDAGVCRGSDGKFQSLARVKQTLGRMHANDEDMSQRERVESP